MIDQTVGTYRVVAKLGEGGMGEVYRAHDAKLNRDVAIKILPDAFAHDAERVARFTREAQTLAALNHPNIAHVYGVIEEPRDGSHVHALVMELVEGEDLSALTARGPVPIADALAIAKQIAEALEAAHEHGIIHRDLKPANIKVRADGTVKVLDFGLAKAMDPAGTSHPDAMAKSMGTAGTSHPDAMNSPTMTAAAFAQGSGGAGTQLGVIIGTAAYMAPEQAKGRRVDRRADVWAFGVVLYEMLTGKRLFDRTDVSETLAAVLTGEPDVAALPASTPTAVTRLLTRCLVKDPRQRVDSMAVVRLELDEIQRQPTHTPPASSRRMTLVVAAIVVAAGTLGWLAAKLVGPAAVIPAASEIVISEVPAPVQVITAFQKGFALSPDGGTLVFSARLPSGVRQLWVRSLGSTTARPIPGTEDGTYPFWSPDGRHVAFFAGTRLKRVPIAGGEVQTVCEAPGQFRSGSWSVHDQIVYGALDADSRIYKVAAGGGTPQTLDALGRALHPQWFRDGRRLVFAGSPMDSNATRALYVGATDGTPPTLIPDTSGDADFALAPVGPYLLRNQHDVLTAQKLDEETARLLGPAVTIAGQAGTPNQWTALSAGADRLVGYVKLSADRIGDPGDPWAKLDWVARDGTPAGTACERGQYWTLALSPDGQRLATNPSPNLWMLDGRRLVRLTSGTLEFAPTWSADGRQLVYQTNGRGIYLTRLDREEPATKLQGVEGTPVDWSRDGRWLTVNVSLGTSTGRDIVMHDLQTHATKPWLATAFNEWGARFSPDGRWVTYVSDSSGRAEVYVRRVDGGGTPVAVSTTGGIHPRWRRDGRELFFLGPADELMAVDVTIGRDTVTVGVPKKLFAVPLNDVATLSFPPYDVSPDGQRFILNVPDRPESLFFIQGLEALIRNGAGGPLAGRETTR